MATYNELYGLRNNSELRNKVVVAVIVAAETIRNEDGGTPNHANRLLWAAQAFANPLPLGQQILWALLAANKDNAVPAIEGASDEVIQAAVDAVVDLFATG